MTPNSMKMLVCIKDLIKKELPNKAKKRKRDDSVMDVESGEDEDYNDVIGFLCEEIEEMDYDENCNLIATATGYEDTILSHFDILLFHSATNAENELAVAKASSSDDDEVNFTISDIAFE